MFSLSFRELLVVALVFLVLLWGRKLVVGIKTHRSKTHEARATDDGRIRVIDKGDS